MKELEEGALVGLGLRCIAAPHSHLESHQSALMLLLHIFSYHYGVSKGW